ncbi:MAG: SIS domain-containing protein [Candidatus Eremiobacteraeota bacterium]|nr:SIS domain-containing protein [Candidatus Eremiobacteraeota bacterium]
MFGERFEIEIREQPAVWDRIAQSDRPLRLARAIDGRDVVLVGSGSSLFTAQLGAMALRRRRVRAHALAATEATQDHAAYRDAMVIACSQSGESADVLRALDVLQPSTVVALTNSPASTLGTLASLTIDVAAGAERAVPASKSVSATTAVLLCAAAALDSPAASCADELRATAALVARWLEDPGVSALRNAASRIATQRSVVVLGTGYGLPVALEAALKLKEASYIHAEGFAAGEFRHGSAAILNASCAVVGIVEDRSREVVEQPLRAAAEAGSECYTIGRNIDGIVALGPSSNGTFAPLAWLVAAQLLALEAGRARNVDSDAPRGLSKIVLNRT